MTSNTCYNILFAVCSASIGILFSRTEDNKHDLIELERNTNELKWQTDKNKDNINYYSTVNNQIRWELEKKTNELEWIIEKKDNEYYETKNNINKFCNSSLEQLVIQSDKQHSIVANNLVEFCKQLSKK